MRLALTFIVLCLCAARSTAQIDPSQVAKPVTAKDVEEIVNKLLDGAPEGTLEVEGVAKITWKRYPVDIAQLALRFGENLPDDKKPKGGVTLESFVVRFHGQIEELLTQRLSSSFGKLQALAPLTAAKKEIPAGEHQLVVVYKGGKPGGVVVAGEEMPKKKPLALKGKPIKPKEPRTEVVVELKVAEKKKEDDPTEYELFVYLPTHVLLEVKDTIEVAAASGD